MSLYQPILEAQTMVSIEGEIKPDHFTGSARILVDHVVSWETLRATWMKTLQLYLTDGETFRDDAVALKSILMSHPGDVPVRLRYGLPPNTQEIPMSLKVELNDALEVALKQIKTLKKKVSTESL